MLSDKGLSMIRVSLDNFEKKRRKKETVTLKLCNKTKASKQGCLLTRHDYEDTVPQEISYTELCTNFLN